MPILKSYTVLISFSYPDGIKDHAIESARAYSGAGAERGALATFKRNIRTYSPKASVKILKVQARLS